MLLGYNTNGFAHHRIEDALAVLAEIGYRGAAITLDAVLLDPPDRRGVAAALERLRPATEAVGLRVTIETGARFILDPRRKHQPTLVSASAGDRSRRVEYLKAAVEIAAGLSADSVSLWSGSPDDICDDSQLLDRLTRSLGEVLDYARAKGVRLGFEPEPGMFIDRVSGFGRLHSAMDDPLFGLTLDVGHLHCLDDGDLGEHLRRWREVLCNVHIEDMRRGVHQHLMFGEGEMDFSSVFGALSGSGYTGPVHVELSHHSHDAVETARTAYRFLSRFV